MSRSKNNRKSPRLNVDNGVVILRIQGYAALACALGDLSEGGCGCRVLPDSLSRAGEKWRQHLVFGQQLEAELDRPPMLSQLTVNAQVCHVKMLEDGTLSVGLLFLNPAPDQHGTLAIALMQLAAAKMKRAGDAPPAPPATPTKFVVPPPPPPPTKSLPVVPPPPPPKPATTTTRLGSKLPTLKMDRVFLAKKSVAEVLALLGGLKPEQAAEATRAEPSDLRKHCRFLIDKNWANPAEICHALSLRSGLPVTNLEENEPPPLIAKRFSYLQMMQQEFVPFTDSKDMVCVAVALPLSSDMASELEKVAGKPVLQVLAPMDQIRQRLFQTRPRQEKKREHVRVKAVIHVVYQFCNQLGLNISDAFYEGFTIDISTGGFLIAAPAAPDLDPKDLLKRGACARVEVVQGSVAVNAMCKVRHLEAQKNPKDPNLPWLMGLEITRISSEHARALKDMCLKQGTDAFFNRKRGFDLPGFSR